MAAIQNDRDVLLQAASVRVVPVPIDPSLIPGLAETIAATKGIKLSAPSNVFQISTGGAASPSSITVTATLTLVASPVTWDIFAGTATLTGSGSARTLTAANMVSNSVTIRARAQESGGPIYTDYWTIAKTADGANGANGTNGTPGANGERGSITAFGTLSNLVSYPGRAGGRARWAAGSATEGNAGVADTAARNVIWQRLGNSGSAPSNAHMRLGDTVTLTNSTQTVSATGYWTGANWDTPGTVIDGNLLVGGNVAGQEFTGGIFTGGKFRTAATGDRVEIDSSNNTLTIYKGVTPIFTCNPSVGYTRINAVGGVSAIEVRGGSGPGVDVVSSGRAAVFKTVGGSGVDSGVVGVHTGTGGGYGGGVLGTADGTGAGVYGRSESGYGGVFESNAGTPVRLVPVSSLPPNKTKGALCLHTTHGLCVADGTSWQKVTTTAVT